jgi:hypothetical protein
MLHQIYGKGTLNRRRKAFMSFKFQDKEKDITDSERCGCLKTLTIYVIVEKVTKSADKSQ